MIILYLLFAVIGLGILMAAIGMGMRPDHLAARQADLPRPADEIYAVIRDVEAMPTWRKEVKKVELLPPVDGRPMFREHSRQGAITYAIDADDPPTADRPGRMVNRIADERLPFGGRWIITVAPAPGGSRVTLTEDGVVKNPLFRFLSRTVFSLTKTQEQWLRALGRHVGADVTPRPATPATETV